MVKSFQVKKMIRYFYLTHRKDNRFPFQVRVDLGVIAMKRYSTFSKALELELNHQIQFSVISRTLIEGSNPPKEMQLACSTTPADMAVFWLMLTSKCMPLLLILISSNRIWISSVLSLSINMLSTYLSQTNGSSRVEFKARSLKTKKREIHINFWDHRKVKTTKLGFLFKLKMYFL